MFKSISTILVGVITTLAVTAFADNKKLADLILPRPQKCMVNNGIFEITSQSKIYITSDGSDQGKFTGTRLAQLLDEQQELKLQVIQKTGNSFSLFLGNEASDAADKISLDAIKGKKEGYILKANENGVAIKANTAQGLFHGAMTLRQLVKNNKVMGCSIIDYPRYELRGFMVDSGRAPVRLGHIKRIIRINSAFKMNFMLFRESDNELNAVKYDNNPLGSKNPEALTMDEVKEMIEYAALHGIQVIPEIEALGHAGARRMHYPELIRATAGRPYSKGKDGKAFGMHWMRAHLLPSDERSFAVLESVLSEWFAATTLPYIHLGMDEIRMPKPDQAKHLEQLIPRVLKLAEKYHQSPKFIVWSDAPETPEEYKNIVIRSPWSYGNRSLEGGKSGHLKHQKIESLLKEGATEKVLMGAGSSSSHNPGSKCGYEKAFRNLAEWSIIGDKRDNFVGITSCQWHGNQLDKWLPDFLAAADVSWNPPGKVPEYAAQMRLIQDKLAEFKDFTNPKEAETTPAAWYGVWTKDNKWHKFIAPLPVPMNKRGQEAKPPKKRKKNKK